MRYRFLGQSGLEVSELSFGSWVSFGPQMDVNLAEECMHLAHDAGVNFFDNAETYADGVAEKIMGEILQRSGWPREDFVVSTKIFWGGIGPNRRGLSRKHILEGVDAALSRFRLDYVDLVFCHRFDLHTPIEETVRAMDHLIRRGKALYWGTSEWPADRILQAWHIARREHLTPPLMEQPQYNMFHRDRLEREYAFLYDDIGLGTTIWSPLASGLLTGKYNDGVPEDSRAQVQGYEWLRERFEGNLAQERIPKIRKLMEISGELGCTMAQLALAWCLKNPHVNTVITGASRPSQVEENLQALAVVDALDEGVMDRIEEILGNRPQAEHDFR